MSEPETLEVVGEVTDDHPMFYEILDDLNGILSDTEYQFVTAHGPADTLLVVDGDDA